MVTEKDPLVRRSKDEEALPTRLEDAKDILGLMVPIFFSMLSWVAMKTTDSALLGHVSAESLAAAALADLWTSCTQGFIRAGVLGVLVSSAVGAGNPKLAGIYLQVSYTVLVGVGIFVAFAWSCTELFWKMNGSDPRTSHLAGYYAGILSLSIPGQIAFGQLTQFFSAQRIMRPEVVASTTAMFVNLVLGLVLVLGIPIPGFDGFGFPACPAVTSAAVYVQIFVVLFFFVYMQRLHEPAWDGWSMQEITGERLRRFCDLYIPAAFASASDFWRVAVIGVIAAAQGETEVAVFNTGYRVMWIVLILVNSIASASGIKTTTRLGQNSVKGAQQASETGIVMSVLLLLVIGGLAAWKSRFLAMVFTNDEEFLNVFEMARWPFSITLVMMNLSVALERVPYAMGRTKEVFWYGFAASWLAQVPAVFLLTKYWRNDIIGLYSGVIVGYVVLSILYGWMVYTR